MLVSIIVTYNPISNIEISFIEALRNYYNVLIVDNSTDESAKQMLRVFAGVHEIEYHFMGENTGIATAQNWGVLWAIKQGAIGVSFFDQDSTLDAYALCALSDSILKSQDTRCADAIYCIQRTHKNETTYPTYPVSFSETRELMSSGSGCLCRIFNLVGLFEDQLFIDCVDYEWGWRAASKKVSIISIECGRFTHTFGDSEHAIMGMSFHFGPPLRSYYQFRNIIFMLLRDYVPWKWKMGQVIRSIFKIMASIVMCSDRYVRLRFIIRGIGDAIIGRTGPYIPR